MMENKKAKELREKIFESTKDVKVDMEIVEKLSKEQPNNMQFQDVKNPKEFQMRNHALHYSMLGDYEKAIEYADKGIEINPKSAHLFYIRGRSKGDLDMFEEGIEDLNKALEIKPDYADAFVERGYIKQKRGDIKGAGEDYKKAREIEPDIVLPE